MNDRLHNAITGVSDLQTAPVVYLHVAIFMAPGFTRASGGGLGADAAWKDVVGDATFRLVHFQGQENIADHFDYELELHGNTDADAAPVRDFTPFLGRPITVGIHYPALDDGGQQPTRDEANAWFANAIEREGQHPQLALFNGIVASFSVEQPGVYRVSMRPAMWKLTLTNAYCIHRQVSVAEAIAGVLKKHNITFSMPSLLTEGNLAMARHQDWLQAGETDYEFVRRLMGKAHIYYFYVSTGTSHTVVFANCVAYPQAMPQGKPLRYCGTDVGALGLAQPDVISDYRFQQSLSSSAVSSVFTRDEAAWEVPGVPQFHSYYASSKSTQGPLPFKQYLLYQYGCSQSEVEDYARATQDSLHAASQQFSGASFCPFLRSGHRFTVTQELRAGQWPQQVRPELEGQSFVALQVEHQASLDGSYQNKFQATDASALVTPFSIQETQQGSVLAQVVAGDHGAIPSGWRYYEKKYFDTQTVTRIHDQHDTGDSAPMVGVFVRFSSDQQARGVKDSSTLFEGTDSSPVWVKLAPHMQTAPEIGVTVLVTRASDQSELPEIQSIVQANGTQVVKPTGWTASTNVGSNYSTAYGDGKNIHFGLKSNADLNRAVSIVTEQYDTGKFRDTAYSQGASYSYSTSENGKDGLLNQSDSYGSTYSTHHGAVSSSDTVFDKTVSHSRVNLESSSTSLVLGIQSSDSTVNINRSTSATLLQDSKSLTAVSNSNNATVAQNEFSMTGVSMRTSLLGDSTSLSVTGSSTDISLAGEVTNVAIKEMSNSIEITGSGIVVQLAAAQASMQITGLSLTITELKIYL